MNIKQGALGSFLAVCLLGLPVGIQAVTLDLTNALGRVQSGASANSAVDEAYVNSLVDRANGVSPSTYDFANHTYTLLNDPTAVLPFAIYVTGGGVGNDHVVDVGTTGYRYLAMKYDGEVGSMLVWDILGMTGNLTVLGEDLGKTQNNYMLFNGRGGDTPTIPDAGSSMVLMGLAILGLGWARRRIPSA
jgi:hypothetical protein